MLFKQYSTDFFIEKQLWSLDWNGESLEKIVLAPILKFLERKGFLDVSQNPLPQDVLDAVSNACKESAGYPVCIRAATTFKVAVLLNMSCVELAQFGPNKVSIRSPSNHKNFS